MMNEKIDTVAVIVFVEQDYDQPCQVLPEVLFTHA